MPLMVDGVQVNLTAKNDASPVIKQVASDVQALETQNGNMGASATGAGGDIAGMAITATQLGQALSIVTIGVAAFVAAFEFGEIAAGNERLMNSGEQLAARYGESLDNIVKKVGEASLGTVSNMDIIASSNKAMMLGVGGNAEQLASLMEIAAFRGRAMGISTSQAFDDISRGIGRMSPMILDNLGIIVDAKTTYGNYAESIGKSANELTRAEKIQALLNKVLEEGNAQLEEAGGLAEDNATSYERWNAELENTQNYLLESTLGMSRFADMGADLLVVIRDLADNGFGYGKGDLNAWSLLMELGAARVAKHKEEIYAATDAIAAHGEALNEIIPKVTTLAEAEAAATEVDADAVKGAMQVHDTYDKLDGKMADLKLDHDELLAKKQELISQGWWPESEKIQDVNDKLADNEKKQKDVTLAMQGTLAQMLLNTAAAGLDAEGQLALARATGQIDEATYAALSAQGLLKKEYEDGKISAEEYAKKTVELQGAVDKLQSKNIEITVGAIFNELHNVTTSYMNLKSGGGPVLNSSGKKGYATGTDGWESVPSGYPNDTYPILLSSGERFAVIPEGTSSMPTSTGGMGGGIFINFTYAPEFSLGSEAEMRDKIAPVMMDLLREAQNNGVIPS